MLKAKTFYSFKRYFFDKSDSNYKNCKAYDHYLSKLRKKCYFPVNLDNKVFPLLMLCFCGWKNFMNYRKKILKSIIFKRIQMSLQESISKWRVFRQKATLDSIFRNLELELKTNFKSVTQKKVRFNF